MSDKIYDRWVTVEELTLATMRIGAKMAISREYLQDIEVVADPIRDWLSLVFHGRQAYVKGDVLEVPLSWWDHVKQRIRQHPKWPGFVKARIKEVRTAKHEAIAMIPDLPIARRTVKYASFPTFHQLRQWEYDKESDD